MSVRLRLRSDLHPSRPKRVVWDPVPAAARYCSWLAAFPALALQLADARLGTVPGYFQTRLAALRFGEGQLVVAPGYVFERGREDRYSCCKVVIRLVFCYLLLLRE